MNITKIEKLMQEIENNLQLIREELATQSDVNEQHTELKIEEQIEDEIISHVFAKVKCPEKLENLKSRIIKCLLINKIYNMSDLKKSTYHSLSRIHGMGGQSLIFTMTITEKYYQTTIFVLSPKMRLHVEELKEKINFNH